MKFFNIPFHKLTEAQKMRLLSLTNPDGMMNFIIRNGSMTGAHSPLMKLALATDNGKIVGWVAAEPEYNIPADEGNADYLLGVFVDPEYRNKGIGKQLVKHLIKTNRQIKNVTLNTHDQISSRLYKSVGKDQVDDRVGRYTRHHVDLDQKIENPKTGRRIKLRTALGYEDDEPVKKSADQFLSKNREET